MAPTAHGIPWAARNAAGRALASRYARIVLAVLLPARTCRANDASLASISGGALDCAAGRCVDLRIYALASHRLSERGSQATGQLSALNERETVGP
jgi:hypothetical protein